MNSNWVLHKIGLVDFWYYDEQEFSFLKGRMLLRGSNGSGKSVTMQSVVPLLLDGNMRPERLDPFGSRDRKMVNYLLEEGDEREERTGYLYMELKRADSDTYLTLGIGMRARKGKPLDPWYFAITDGRRVKKDFYLYRETDVKITLSQKELENRLGSGGVVFSTQQEYMNYVNRQVFGFETLDEYKEMIDLLIQLRTPKLSKDFKPSVINEILSDSLQPLSEEDLRPISESIENMDNLTLNLQNKTGSKQALDKIIKQYRKYNECLLFEKASQYQKESKEKRKIETQLRENQETVISKSERVIENDHEVERLENERRTCEKEKDSLNATNAVVLKNLEVEVQKRIDETNDNLKKKEKQLEEKQAKWQDYAAREKRGIDEKESQERQIGDGLKLLGTYIEEVTFDEYHFLVAELQENMTKPYEYKPHINMVNNFQEKLEEGIQLIKNAEEKNKRKEELIKSLDIEKKHANSVERKIVELNNQFVEIQNETKEAIYAWNGNNLELKMPEEMLRKIGRFLEEYTLVSDYNEMKQAVSDVQIALKEQLQQQKSEKSREFSILSEKLEELSKQLKEWQHTKESEPECSEAVSKNRAKLQGAKIPYERFFKVVDFEKETDNVTANHLEEALLEMGLLDALVIDSEYKEAVLKLDMGMCDKYIFADEKRISKNLSEFITISEEANDIFLNQKITKVLGNIGVEEGSTRIRSDGTYAMGVLTGTITGEYKAKYIGNKAREKHRMQIIQELEEEISTNTLMQEKLQVQIRQLQERIDLLQKEYRMMPTDADIRQACGDLKEEEGNLARIDREIIRIEEVINSVIEEVNQAWRQANQLSETLYMPCRLDQYVQASGCMKEYLKEVYHIQTEHTKYLQILQSIASIEESMENCDEDMDTIRYDITQGKRRLQEDEMEHDSISQQLQLSGYDSVKDRLDICLERLNSIPQQTKALIRQSEETKNQILNLQKDTKEAQERCEVLEKRKKLLCDNLLKEIKLGYVEIPFEIMTQSEVEDKIDKLHSVLEPMVLGLQKDDLSSKVNAAFFENRGLLVEYNPTLDYLFEEDYQSEWEDIKPKRLELFGKYKGKNVKIQELLQYLKEEIEEISNLIKIGDKELFEEILGDIIGRKIRSKINNSKMWVDKMNDLMGSMNTSSGLRLSLRWHAKTAEAENQLDTRELVELLKKDSKLMREEELEKLSKHFRSKVEEARRKTKEGTLSFFVIMKETLDYRKWFEFKLFSQKSGEAKKELTNSVFGTFSGGEKAMSMYVPLFSAVVAKYRGARKDAPRIISLDEAFAGVDNRNIKDMFRLMTEFEFNFIINSQILWGDCDTLDSLAIYQLLRPENVKFVTVMSYLWNGKVRQEVEKIGD